MEPRKNLWKFRERFTQERLRIFPRQKQSLVAKFLEVTGSLCSTKIAEKNFEKPDCPILTLPRTEFMREIQYNTKDFLVY